MATRRMSLTSRRGSGGNTDGALSWTKCLLLASLISFVCFLILLDYQLLINPALGRPATGEARTKLDGAEGAQRRQTSLGEKAPAMKEKHGNTDGVAKHNEHRTDGRADALSSINESGEFTRVTCAPEVTRKQAERMRKRFHEWWSHSGCPDQVWMENIASVFPREADEPYLILDVGCNKGYASADFFDVLSPGSGINPDALLNAIREFAREKNTRIERDGGVCNDAKKPLNTDRLTERSMEVHCFEPSPATYDMLIAVRSKLTAHRQEEQDPNHQAKWHIHNIGLHEVNSQMSWHSACTTAVGDELCTIVPDGTKDAIIVPVKTMDAFLHETYRSVATMPLVHMLKIDAEGLDPAVLAGSTSLLQENRAIMVMFEFNPLLSERDPPHGMWGKRGNPRKTLLEVTDWLDSLGYDCYFDTRLPDEDEKKKGVPKAPALYRITGGCLAEEPRILGWANVVCAARKYRDVALLLGSLATMV